MRVDRMSPQVVQGSRQRNSSTSRNHSGQSTLPSSPNSSGLGSATSLAKSLTNSLQSELSTLDQDLDGDNINVVVRVRPLNPREIKNDDENVIQFPGDGGIWVPWSPALPVDHKTCCSGTLEGRHPLTISLTLLSSPAHTKTTCCWNLGCRMLEAECQSLTLHN